MRSAFADYRSIRVWLLCGFGVLAWALLTAMLGGSAAHADADSPRPPRPDVASSAHAQHGARGAEAPRAAKAPAQAKPVTVPGKAQGHGPAKAAEIAHTMRAQAAAAQQAAAQRAAAQHVAAQHAAASRPATPQGGHTAPLRKPPHEHKPDQLQHKADQLLHKAEQSQHKADRRQQAAHAAELFAADVIDSPRGKSAFAHAMNAARAALKAQGGHHAAQPGFQAGHRGPGGPAPAALSAVSKHHAVSASRATHATRTPTGATAPVAHSAVPAAPQTPAPAAQPVDTAPQHPLSAPTDASPTGSSGGISAGAIPDDIAADDVHGLVLRASRAGHELPPTAPVGSADDSPD